MSKNIILIIIGLVAILATISTVLLNITAANANNMNLIQMLSTSNFGWFIKTWEFSPIWSIANIVTLLAAVSTAKAMNIK